jgi:hypothetical protein
MQPKNGQGMKGMKLFGSEICHVSADGILLHACFIQVKKWAKSLNGGGYLIEVEMYGIQVVFE